jgi:hypothetical protein
MGMTNEPTREVRLSAHYLTDYDKFQLNYMDKRSMTLIPYTKVYVADVLHLEVNSLGCIGPEPPADIPLIGVFGDSVVQGVSDSLVYHIDVPGALAVNSGVEGSQLEHIIGRFEDMRELNRMVCAVIHPGFHNLLYGETSFAWWENQLARLTGVPVIAVVKLNTDLHPEAIARGYAQYYSDTYCESFFSKPETLPRLQEAIERKNRLIDRVCANKGFVAVDLDSVLKPVRYEDVTRKYFDMIHPQPAVYPEIGHAIAGQIAPHVHRALAAGLVAPTQAMPAPPQPSLAEVVENRGRNYPLW